MPLKKLQLKPGLNRENTRYTTEGGWYDCDKIRFRQGTPEKIGGWKRFSQDLYQGVCRSLWNWLTLVGDNLVGVGTNLKFYVAIGGTYFDITPLRSYTEAPVTLNNPFDTVSGSAVINVNDTAHGLTTGDVATFSGAVDVGGILAEAINTNHKVTVVGVDDYTITVFTTATSTVTGGGGAAVSATYTKYNVALTNPFTATLGSSVITVADVAHGALTNDFVTFSGATGLGGNITAGILNQEYQITVINDNSYTITVSAVANATDVSGSPGGGTVSAAYQISAGSDIVLPLVGWGVGTWGSGPWGIGTPPAEPIRLWSQSNYGQDLVFCPRGGKIYYWEAATGVTVRGVDIGTLPGASDTPVIANIVLVSDISRFVFAFGCNQLGDTALDPLLIRWSEQEDISNWTPSAETQAGDLRLSQGSQIVAVLQSRQEILVWTDSALYSLQYQGPPFVWGAQLVGDNISIVGQNATTVASGVTYWMGVDKFYKYDGRTQTLRCDLRQFIFGDLNMLQLAQICCGTNEGFNEVWWFYPSADSTEIDRYAVYNYAEDIWYYGSMGRTAWLDTPLQAGPLAATYEQNLVVHELGTDDLTTGTVAPIEAYITSSEFDLDDGHQFVFVWRVLPDITFRGSSATTPQVTMTLLPLQNSGSGYNNPESVGGVNNATVTRSAVLPVEQFTGQIFTRVRGRQMAVKISSTALGVAWQLGSPRLDMRSDGRR